MISNGAHQEIELSASGRCSLISFVADLALLILNRRGREGRGTEEMFIEREAHEPDAPPPIAAGSIIITRLVTYELTLDNSCEESGGNRAAMMR
jgi:hypothetical protein